MKVFRAKKKKENHRVTYNPYRSLKAYHSVFHGVSYGKIVNFEDVMTNQYRVRIDKKDRKPSI